MNFKKTLTIAGLASLAVVGLASCGGEKEGDYDVTLNLALSYKECYVKYNRDKVTSFKMDPTHTTLDGIVLQEGKTLLPVWQKMSKNLEFNVKDVALSGKDTATVMKKILNNKFKGLKKANVEVLQVATGDTEYVNNVTQGNFINLEDYKAEMPNLFKFLEENPSVYKQLQMTEEGKNEKGIYYAPYFDGIDQIELGFNMNAEAVTALLDGDAEKQWDDTAKTGNRFKNAADFDTATKLNAVYGGSGTGDTASYIQSLDKQTIAIANADGEQDTIEVSFAKDIASIQKDLSVKDGKNLTNALIDYLKATYDIGEGKTFEKPSDIFLGVNACYNADELIALWRCFKTNPNYLVGDANAEMIPFFPRTGNTNRVNAMIKIGQMFGLRGSLAGEKDNLWFNKDGQLVDSRTQPYTYTVLNKLNALKQEGLFPKSWSYSATDGNSEFRSVVIKDGTGFMCYDYTNVTAYNAKKDSKTTQMQQVLSPVAKWPITKDNKDEDIVGATDQGYSYTRFSEDNRALKDGGWSLVKQNLTGKKKDAKLKKALKLMDYMYTQDGSFLEAFGTTGKDTSDKLVEKLVTDANGVVYPKLTSEYIGHIAKYGGGTWHNYMTRYQGACLGIGNVRSNYLEAQNTHELQEVGMKKVAAALKAKAMFQCTSKDKNFFLSVPTTFSVSTAANADIETNAATITQFWRMSNNESSKISEGIVMNVLYNGWDSIEEGYKYAALKSAFDATNASYLKSYATVAGTTEATANQYPYFTPAA